MVWTWVSKRPPVFGLWDWVSQGPEEKCTHCFLGRLTEEFASGVSGAARSVERVGATSLAASRLGARLPPCSWGLSISILV